MKEYRQNAAEADASEIHFVFDNRRAGPSRGPRRRLRPRLRTGTTTHKNGPERATRYPQPIFTFEGKRAATGPSGGRRDKAGVQKLRKSCSGLVRGLFEASNFDQIWRKKIMIFFFAKFERQERTQDQAGNNKSSNGYRKSIQN